MFSVCAFGVSGYQGAFIIRFSPSMTCFFSPRLTAGLMPRNLKDRLCRHVFGLHSGWVAAVVIPLILNDYVYVSFNESSQHLFCCYELDTWTRRLSLHFALWTFSRGFSFLRPGHPGRPLCAAMFWLPLRVQFFFFIFICHLFDLCATMIFAACVSNFPRYPQLCLLLLCSCGARAELGCIWYNRFGLLATHPVSYTRPQIS